MFFIVQKNMVQRLLILLLVTILSGCTIYIHVTKSKYMDEQEKRNSILVFGYFDDSEAPFNMGWGDIKQIRPATDEPYKELRSNGKGLFYLENLPTGSYKLISLDGREKGMLSTQPWTVSFPDPSEDSDFKRTELRAKKPGVYFLGAYKLKLVKKGGFLIGRDKFETMALKKPTEKKLIKKESSNYDKKERN